MAIWEFDMIGLNMIWLNTFVSTIVQMEVQDTPHD